ncbi:septum formation initiator family protein [Gammaproteobacteria bacterium Comchoano-2]|uniref:Septum formation initiator family protein n=2 Tax=Candidatus Synchoanobacter obligatus TaxID=2919597 RepID=A0ABT1L3T6_9GAMM|nr:septum formation initiator family protein [Candidatus Synchoanobacter obligatus]
MIFISSSGVRLYRQLGAAQKEQAQQLAHLKERVATLTFQKEALLSDPMYLEYGVRTQWEMVKPGETVLWYQDL